MIISFDLWGTLIQSSPLFKERKTDLYKKYYPEFSVEKCNETFENTKKELNYVIEKTGWQPERSHIQYMINSNFGINLEDNRIFHFLSDLQKLAKIYNPEFIHKDTQDLLYKLTCNTLILVSNTMFLTGDTLVDILYTMGIRDYFAQFHFSDKVGKSKPSKMSVNRDISYHVGDNEQTDGLFAKAKNAKFIHITDKQDLEYAYNIITQGK